MKKIPWLFLGLIVLLVGSGCQHAVAPPLAMQQKFYSSLINSHPEADRALRSAQYYQLVGRPDLALKELRDAVSSNPQDVRLLNAMGSCHDRLGEYAQAQESYEKVLAQDADNFPARNNLGYSCYLSGDLDRAEKIFQEAISKNPEDTMARNNLGLVWCRQGREQQALSFWQKNEGEIAAREKLQHVLAFLGRPSEKTVIAVPPAPGKAAKGAEVMNDAKDQPATQAPPPAEIARSERKRLESRTAALVEDELKPSSSTTSNSSRIPGKLSQGVPVRVEEVQMVVQPASYSPPQPQLSPVIRESVVPVPQAANPARKPSPPGAATARKTEISLPDSDDEIEEEAPVYRPRYRNRQWRRYWRPRIITCTTPAPPQPIQELKHQFTHETIFQKQSAPRNQQGFVY